MTCNRSQDPWIAGNRNIPRRFTGASVQICSLGSTGARPFFLNVPSGSSMSGLTLDSGVGGSIDEPEPAGVQAPSVTSAEAARIQNGRSRLQLIGQVFIVFG